MNDSISDMLIRIKNASRVDHPSVVIPYSKLKMNIAELLSKEGYVGAVSKKGQKINKVIEIELLYNDQKSKISEIARMSKLSRRIYFGSKDIRPVRHGYGTLVLSTPKGLMTGQEARKKNLGGEALFKIW